MRRSRLLLLPAVVLALFLTSCRDRSIPTKPNAEPSYAKETRDDDPMITALIVALYPDPGLEKAALNIWYNIQRTLARGLIADARAQARALVEQATGLAAEGRLVAPPEDFIPPLTLEEGLDTLVTRLFAFVGAEDFTIGVIDPAEGGTIVTSNGWAAVVAGAGATENTVYVTIELLDEATCAVADPLIQAMGCWDINRYPAGDFDEDVTVEICVADPETAEMTDGAWNSLLVHHKSDDGEVTPLPWAEPTHIDCEGFSVEAATQTANLGPLGSLFASVRSHVADLLMPEPLAARMPFFGPRPPKAAGGTTDTFSEFFAAVPESAEPNLITWWPGDGDYLDMYGQNDGAAQGVVPFGPPAISGQAFQFAGDGNAVLITPLSDAIKSLQLLTVATWVYLDPSGPADAIQRFVTLGDETAVLRQEGGYPRNRMLHFYMKFLADPDLRHIRVDNVLQPGCYHFFAGTYDGTVMRAYLDGVEVGTESVPGGVVAASADFAKLGASGGPGYPGEGMIGALDEVMVFDRALDADEILSMWDYPTGAAKCVAQETYTVSGTVRHSGVAVPGDTVVLAQGTFVAGTTTDSDGHYTFASVAPGTYQVSASAYSSYAPSAPSEFVVYKADVVRDIDVPESILLLAPADGSTVGPDGLSLSWVSNAEADGVGHYEIQIDDAQGTVETAQTATNAYDVAAAWVPGGTYSWTVTAFDSQDHLVGVTERAFTYTLEDVTPVVINGDFETGELSAWSPTGTSNWSASVVGDPGERYGLLEVFDGPSGTNACTGDNFAALDQLVPMKKGRFLELDFLVPPPEDDATEIEVCTDPGFDRIELDLMVVDTDPYEQLILAVVVVDFYENGTDAVGWMNVWDQGTWLTRETFDPWGTSRTALGPLVVEPSTTWSGWQHASLKLDAESFPWLPDTFTARVTIRDEDNRITGKNLSVSVDNVQGNRYW